MIEDLQWDLGSKDLKSNSAHVTAASSYAFEYLSVLQWTVHIIRFLCVDVAVARHRANLIKPSGAGFALQPR